MSIGLSAKVMLKSLRLIFAHKITETVSDQFQSAESTIKNLLPIFTLLLLAACSNEAVEPEEPTVKGTLLLHLHA